MMYDFEGQLHHKPRGRFFCAALGVLVAVGVGCFLLGFVTMSPSAAKPADESGRAHECGNWSLFGHQFRLGATGVSCREARKVMRRPCRVALERRWSCQSLRGSAPFVNWFLTKDLFKGARHPAIKLHRYRCGEAKVTPRLFSYVSHGSPTRRQLLADDVVRCHLLKKGDLSADVENLLGPPGDVEHDGEIRSMTYGLGPGRGSVVQIDSEVLLVEVVNEVVTAVSIVET